MAAAWKAGNREAGEKLCAGLRGAVFGVCWALAGSRTPAEEAMQEAFVRILSGLPSYAMGRPFRPWALQIARNAAIDALRKGRKEPETDAPEPVHMETPLSGLLRRERLEEIAAAIRALPAVSREVLVLKYAQGLANDEIAAILGVGMEVLWMRLSRARREIQVRLA